jgi:hypothetical protein
MTAAGSEGCLQVRTHFYRERSRILAAIGEMNAGRFLVAAFRWSSLAHLDL